jgi:hypothetical protein
MWHTTIDRACHRHNARVAKVANLPFLVALRVFCCASASATLPTFNETSFQVVVVVSIMLQGGHEFQVLRPIVQFVAVDMVDVLSPAVRYRGLAFAAP